MDTRYPGDGYPDGWTLDDSQYSYGAPVSALVLNDNTATLTLRPSQAGELANVEVQPSPNGLVILNQVVTDYANSSHISFRRPPGSNEVIVWGTIGQSVDQWREDLGVPDGGLFAAELMTDLLQERGIAVRDAPRSEHRDLNNVSSDTASAAGTLLAVRESLPQK